MAQIISLKEKLLEKFGEKAAEVGNVEALTHFSPDQIHQMIQRAFELGTTGQMEKIGLPVQVITNKSE